MTDTDILVVGGGHAGCEAALAASRMNRDVLLVTLDPKAAARMSCNPAIGGLAKGQLVREIDALGGEMGRVADAAGIQFRMLNTTKGPAVRSPRAQADRHRYEAEMLGRLEAQPNLRLRAGRVEALTSASGRVNGVRLAGGERLGARAVILTTGTFLNGLMHVGERKTPGGRVGEDAARGLSDSLAALGLELGRLKTGTPPRVHRDTLDYDAMELELGDPVPQPFSFETEAVTRSQVPCHVTATTDRTHGIIRDNLHRSPLYGGRIRGVGPRYCPSIEDKVVRFPDRPQHRIYVEPEGLDTKHVYLNGISTSLPEDVQERIVRSVPGLEGAEILRMGYAVEYDFVPSCQLGPTLEVLTVPGLYLAGQINGTSGYEEAAGQGLMAGINAVLKLDGKPPFTLTRSEAYLGVLVDDLVIRSPREPYRMFTSRAEYRLILRHDNADRRLTPHGHRLGLVSEERYARFEAKRDRIDRTLETVDRIRREGETLRKILRRPGAEISRLEKTVPELAAIGLDGIEREQVEIEIRYEGYIRRQLKSVERLAALERFPLPGDLDPRAIPGLKPEAADMLERYRPATLGQASRIAGVSPADVSVLMIYLNRTPRPRDRA